MELFLLKGTNHAGGKTGKTILAEFPEELHGKSLQTF